MPKCKCPWQLQAGCQWSAGDGGGNPNLKCLSRCLAPEGHQCTYKKETE